MTEERGRALVVSSDPALVEELHRLAAGAGVVPEVVADAASALRGWAGAGVVLVGAELAGPLASLGPPRRSGVHVVCNGGAGDPLFRLALELGAEAVLDVDRAGPWLVELMAAAADPRPPGLVVGVLPGSGGAGASTLACALGQVAARRGPALVVDADPAGSGADRVLGLDGESGLGWEELGATTGRLSGPSLREAVPRRGELGVVTWGTSPVRAPSPEVLRETVEAARRAHDLVVVDLPRAPGSAAAEVVGRCDQLLVVVRPTLTGVTAATRVVAALEGFGELVVRGRGLAAEAVGRTVGVPVLLEMADQRGLDESIDLGLGPVRGVRGPLGRAATDLLDGLAARVGRSPWPRSA